MADLESKPLAELHRLASEAGIEKFRLLRREELIERLGGSGGEDGSSADSANDSGSGRRSRRSRRSRSRRRPGSGESDGDGGDANGRGRDSGDRQGTAEVSPVGRRESESRKGESRRGRDDRKDGDAGEPELTVITGTLDILPRGSGVIRSDDGPEAGVHVSPAQIRRCELRAGDEVSGPVRPARRGERRPSLVRVEKVNGNEPADDRSPRFDSLTPVAPHRPIPLGSPDGEVLARAVDLLAPLAFGQRVLVESQRRSGRTTLLKALARSIAAGDSGAKVTVLLVDERPEEVTAWGRDVPGVDLVAAPVDLGSHDQVKVAERALARVKRQAESGEDVVLVIDSLTRLGSAYGDAGAVKPYFGIGRELEEEGSGSITVIATALIDSERDQPVLDAVRANQNSTVKLDASLAASGVHPPLGLAACVTTDQAGLIGDEGAASLGRLRAELDLLDPQTAAARLIDLLQGTTDNAELRARY